MTCLCNVGVPRRLAPLLFLAACSLPDAGPAPDIYNLTPLRAFAQAAPRVSWQLVVEEPVAPGGLDTTRIVLKPGATRIKYFAGARWSERAPQMVQTLMVESFENSGRIVAVGRQSIGLRSDYVLKSDLRAFQAEYFDGATLPTVRVHLRAKLTKQPRLAIIASRSFEVSRQARGTAMRDIVAAFDEALGRVLGEVVEWVLTTP